MPSLAPKQLVGARYRLIEQIGEGGMGVVWSAHDERGRERVALKFLRPVQAVLGTPRMTPSFDKTGLRRFVREARAAMAVKHPNIVRVLEIARAEDGTPFIAMELLEGEPLSARLAREKRLTVSETARILLQVVSAVGGAHAKGIVHRDLKPDNLFLVRGAARDADVRVLDFGIAKLTASDGEAAHTGGLTGTGSMLGTPYYMSPEQVFGEKDVDQRADVWSLGVMLYECLAGVRPIAGDTIGQIVKGISSGKIIPLASVAPDLPEDLLSLCARMLAPERESRVSDLREVREVLLRHTDVRADGFGQPTLDTGATGPLDDPNDEALLAEPDSFSLTRAEPPPRRARALGLVAIGLVAGAAAILLLSSRAPQIERTQTASPATAAAPSQQSSRSEPVATTAAPVPSASTVPSASAAASPTKPVASPTAAKKQPVATAAPTSTTTAPPAKPKGAPCTQSSECASKMCVAEECQ